MGPPKGIQEEREGEELSLILEGKLRLNTTGILDMTPIIWPRHMGFGKVLNN